MKEKDLKLAVMKQDYAQAKKILVSMKDELSPAKYAKYIEVIEGNKLLRDKRYNQINKEWKMLRIKEVIVQTFLVLISILIILFDFDFLFYMLGVSIVATLFFAYSVYSYPEEQIIYLIKKRYGIGKRDEIEEILNKERKNSLLKILLGGLVAALLIGIGDNIVVK